MNPDTRKLPKWAQQHIRMLERNAAYWKDLQLRTANGETRVWLASHYPEPHQALPPGSDVLFHTGEPPFEATSNPDTTLLVGEIQDREGVWGIEIYSAGPGGLSIVPKVSNVVEIYPKEL